MIYGNSVLKTLNRISYIIAECCSRYRGCMRNLFCLNSINDYIYIGQAQTIVPKCIHITVAVYGGMLFTEGSQ